MCHERWITHSDAAVERSWLRSLSQRQRDEQRVEPPAREDDAGLRDDPRLEVVGER